MLLLFLAVFACVVLVVGRCKFLGSHIGGFGFVLCWLW